jgi:hypothetical protein
VERELFVRNVPPEMTTTDQIPLGHSSLPPLQFSRRELIDAVREIDPAATASTDGAPADSPLPYRLDVKQPGLRLAIAIPPEDPLTTVLIRIFGASDQHIADQFIGQLLERLDARAFGTYADTLILSHPT